MRPPWRLLCPGSQGSSASMPVGACFRPSVHAYGRAYVRTYARAGQEKRTGNRTEIALLDLARLLGADPRDLRRRQRQLAQVRARCPVAAPPRASDALRRMPRRHCWPMCGVPKQMMQPCIMRPASPGCIRRCDQGCMTLMQPCAPSFTPTDPLQQRAQANDHRLSPPRVQVSGGGSPSQITGLLGCQLAAGLPASAVSQ